MYDCLVGRHIDTAVFFRTGQPKHVVIFIDGSAHCAKAVMAVGQHIRNREPLEAGRSRRLNDPHKCNIMRGELVKLDVQILHIV